MTMKALTIFQPYAWLIVTGIKTIENRTWSTRHRGPLLIHAGAKWHTGWQERIARLGIAVPDDLPLRGVAGIVELTGVVTKSDSPWFDGPYGWTLTNPRRIPFAPLRGAQGLFNIDNLVVSPDLVEAACPLGI
jgi:ASCH domain